MEFSLNIFETMALVSIVLYVGKYTRNKSSLLSKYCIPPSVVGGFIFSILILTLKITNIATINLDTTLQELFMTAFFTSIGFTASFKILKQGGIKVAIFLSLSILLVILQNIVGITFASIFNLNPLLGLCTGSIPLVGGPGTAASFGPLLEQIGVNGATTVSMASATFGLIMGSIIGGFVARTLIHNYKIKTPNDENPNNLTKGAENYKEEDIHNLCLKKLVNGASFLFIAMGFGSIISEFLQNIGLTFPSYIGAMLAAAIIRNTFDLIGKDIVEKEIETLGSLSLSFFLTMALMSLKLWQLFDLALPLIVMLMAQVILAAYFTYFIIYKVMGKNYESVVFASAACGFGMGSTANAIANMDELANKYGFVHTPYLIVPIVGCLFIDFFNAAIITLFINFI